MNNFSDQALSIKNVNSPFTEIFSLLTKYEIQPDNTLRLAYASEELKVMRHHIDNVIEVMLHGLQDIGNLLANLDRNKVSLEGVGSFISLICNLIEALNWVVLCI